jgi:3'(2'), 5'-bisphosphate nucleotidase
MLDIEKIIAIAITAGEEILAIYQKDDFGTREKSDHSPLTEADIASHKLITQQLQKLTPNIPVLSEESAVIPWEVRKTWHRYWLIDPLDGTKEFIKHNGEFTVNIALIDHHEPVLGVVHAPVLDTTWVGEKNGQAIKIQAGKQKKINVVHHVTGTPWKVAGSRTHAGDSLQTFLANLGPYELISMGSSIKLCLVAEGKADIYPRLGPTSEWDTAAAHAVVNAAGGEVVIAESGQLLLYNTKDSLLNPHFLVQAIAQKQPR